MPKEPLHAKQHSVERHESVNHYDRKAPARSSRRSSEKQHAKALVYLRAPQPSDALRFCELMLESRKLHANWVQPPLSAVEFAGYLKRNRAADFAGMLLCRHEDDDIVGVFNLSQIVHGALMSAYLGYYVAALHAHNGYMRAGLQLALRHAFRDLKLHRLEANIQPRNVASRSLVQQAGFRLEGFSPRYLKIGGRWRDHERWAILAEEWHPSTP